jgi:hypothetical protein
MLKRLVILAALLVGADAAAQVCKDTVSTGACGATKATEIRCSDGAVNTCRNGTWTLTKALAADQALGTGWERDGITEARRALRFTGGAYLRFPMWQRVRDSSLAGWNEGTLLVALYRDVTVNGTYYAFELSPMTSRSTDSIRLYILDSYLTLEILDSSGTQHRVRQSVAAWTVSAYYQVAVSWNTDRAVSGSNFMELWVNGSNAGNLYDSTTASFTLAANASWDTAQDDFYFGNSRLLSQAFQGAVDVIAYIGRNLSTAEQAAYFADPPATGDFATVGEWELEFDRAISLVTGNDIDTTPNRDEPGNESGDATTTNSTTDDFWNDSTPTCGTVNGSVTSCTNTSGTTDALYSPDVEVVTGTGAGYTENAATLTIVGTKVWRGWLRTSGGSVAAQACIEDADKSVTEQCTRAYSGTTWAPFELVFYLPTHQAGNTGNWRHRHGGSGTSYWDLHQHATISTTTKTVRGDFESFTAGLGTGWTQSGGSVAQEASDVHGGSGAQKVTRAGSDAYVYQTIAESAASTGTRLNVVAWAKSVTGAATATLEVSNTTDSTTSSVSTSSTTWTRLVLDVGLQDSDSLDVRLKATGADGDVLFDDVFDTRLSVVANDADGAVVRSAYSTLLLGDIDFEENLVPHGGPAGAVLGSRAAPWRSVHTREPYVLTVGPDDGTGNFDTVADAWAAVPSAAERPYVIELLPGTHVCSHGVGCDDNLANRQLKSKNNVHITGRNRGTTRLLRGLNFWDVEGLEISNLTFGDQATQNETENGRAINIACDEDSNTTPVADCDADCSNGGCSDNVYVHDITCYTGNICVRTEGVFDDTWFVDSFVSNSLLIGNEGINFEKGNLRAHSVGNTMHIFGDRAPGNCNYKQVGIEIGSIESDVDTYFESVGDQIFVYSGCDSTNFYGAGIDFFRVTGDNALAPKYSKIVGTSIVGWKSSQTNSVLRGILLNSDASTQQTAVMEVIGSNIQLHSLGGGGKLLGIDNSHTGANPINTHISATTVETHGSTTGTKADLFCLSSTCSGSFYVNGLRRSDRTAPTLSGVTWGTKIFALDANIGAFGDRFLGPDCKASPPTGGVDGEWCYDATADKLCVNDAGTWKCTAAML